ncbi:MAG: CHAT domain-containing protein [Propionibacteriaceae bacterium]|jgi:tetratricopeptide (TPR) repeat protein|nr:CHAT domain-containing protein [Propionibacteriaceae bacterium]
MPTSRVFISYAHDTPEHERVVADFWVFLRQCGVDARLDVYAAQFPQDWPLWMETEITAADFVLMIASPAYRRRSGAEAAPGEGRGVQWEARLIRDAVYSDQEAGGKRFLPVVLPGRSAEELPVWAAPASHTYYTVTSYTPAGVEPLLRYLTDQTQPMPPLGELVRFDQTPPAAPSTPPTAAVFRALQTDILVSLTRDSDQTVTVSTEVDRVLSGKTTIEWPPVPLDVLNAVAALTPTQAAQKLRQTGQQLARVVWSDATLTQLSRLLAGRLIEQAVGLTVVGPADLLQTLPVELLWLPDAAEPICLEPGVTVCRRLADAPRQTPVVLPGPVKLLAAVAAPEGLRPLDVEADMQAVLDATQESARKGQLRILELAHPDLITSTLEDDRFHVLHLSAHGNADQVWLETDDGQPLPVDAEQLLRSLRRAGQPIPLVVLSSCSKMDTDHPGLAANLVAQGADRVIAMQASVTDVYATELTGLLYTNLVKHPAWTVAHSLADARHQAEQRRRHADSQRPPRRPEWPLATLWTAAGDAPLVDPALPKEPLKRPPEFPQGGQVRQLRLGELIGRRAEVRQAMAVFRRRPAAKDRHGSVGGVILTGLGGIGKTAIAGRLTQRLRDDGWMIAVHEGAWNPAALFTAVTQALEPTDMEAARVLGDGSREDAERLDVVAQSLARCRLLILFDDFEQNLSLVSDGSDGMVAFRDDEAGGSVLGDTIRALTETAARNDGGGGVLVTSRYPLPDQAGLFLARIEVPPLSNAELGRLFLRLPALRELSRADWVLLHSTIGGHPRLVYFVDALLRGGRSNLPEITASLNQLARDLEITLGEDQAELPAAVRTALILGSQNILLKQLLDQLTADERAILNQAQVCRMALPPADLALAVQLHQPPPTEPFTTAVNRLRDLTLLLPGPDIEVIPALREMLAEGLPSDTLTTLHSHAIALHQARAQAGFFSLYDAVDPPYHLAAVGQTEDAAELIAQIATRQLDGTLQRLSYLTETIPALPKDDRSWAVAAEVLTDAHTDLGDTTAARAISEDIHRQNKRRAEIDPGNAGWQRDLSVSHDRLGDLAVAAGDGSGARAHYEAALAISERLAGSDPGNAGWQRDLSISHERLGNLAVAAGDGSGARAHYEAALAIRERLAEADPGNAGWQRDLSISHNKLGDLAVAAGDGSGARAHYEKGLAIAERLVQIDPGNVEWQRDLSRLRSRLENLD